ncbi:hypothetical protein V8C35DRAFT_172135 [Trichoderma chlorosporum]
MAQWQAPSQQQADGKSKHNALATRKHPFWGKRVLWLAAGASYQHTAQARPWNAESACTVQRCIAPLSLHPSLKTAWPNQPVIGNTANWWPSGDPSSCRLRSSRGHGALAWEYEYLCRTMDASARRNQQASLRQHPSTEHCTQYSSQQQILQHGHLASPARCYPERSRQLQYQILLDRQTQTQAHIPLLSMSKKQWRPLISFSEVYGATPSHQSPSMPPLGIIASGKLLYGTTLADLAGSR